MNEKYLKILEFDKIVDMACNYAVCDETKENLKAEKMQCDVAEVRLALQKVNCLTELLIKNSRPRYSNIEGAKNAVNRALKGGVLSMAELLNVGHALRNFANLSSWYSTVEHDILPVDDYFYALTPQPSLEKSIFACILSETEMADTASDTLYDLRRKIRSVESSIRDTLDGIVKSQTQSKFLQDAVVSLRNGRYVVPVKAEHKGDMQGVIHDVSSSGATIFVEPNAVVQANAKILQLKNSEQAEIERILSDFSNKTAMLEPLFSHSYDAMLKIDKLLSKAHLAVSQNATMPTVNEDMHLDLIRARHPLIPKDNVVPIDISLGKDYDALIVTGPNTGGKTVTLKTVGLLSTMAQCGYLLPAHETSSVCVFEDVLADIGDEQSIEQSLSTFSGHIKNITQIIEHIGAKTLVLMDELGSGTDPAEGAALAVSILEEMRKSGTLIMASTHYAELKIFALDTQGVQNASCEFDVQTLRPTYKISMGVPGKSNAFLISEKLGLPMHIIKSANVHLSREDKRLNSVLVQLEDLKLELNERTKEIEELKNIAKTELEKAQKEREALIKQGENELEIARQKAEKLINDVQNTAFALTDELKVLQKNENMSANQRAMRAREIAKKETEKLFENTAAPKEIQNFKPLKSVKIGDEVYIISLGKPGVVQNLPDKNNMVEIRAGVIKTKVKMDGLAEFKREKPQKKQVQYQRQNTRQSVASNAVRTAGMEINLIGMHVEEALMETDKFIDGGVLSGQSTLYLIHGKGEGILRKAIHEHLKRHRNVKSYRLGAYGEGESGVTVLELK